MATPFAPPVGVTESVDENGNLVQSWPFPDGATSMSYKVDGSDEVKTIAIPQRPVGTYPLPKAGAVAESITLNGKLVRDIGPAAAVKGLNNAALWDGLTNDVTLAADAQYTQEGITHSLQASYDGILGNSSYGKVAPELHHRGYRFYRGMVEANGYYWLVKEYVEGPSPLVKVPVSNVQAAYDVFDFYYGSGTGSDYICTDGTRVYYSRWDRLGSGHPNRTWVAAYDTSTNKSYTFTSGSTYRPNHSNTDESAAFLLTTDDNTNFITGLAVQKSGNFLVASYAAKNQYVVANKLTGAVVKTVSFTSPKELVFDQNDHLWINQGDVCTRVSLASDGTPSGALATMSVTDAVALGMLGNLLIVAEAGANQQVKAFNSAGSLQWVHGTAGGQQASSLVEDSRYYFSDISGSVHEGFLCGRADGTLWVGDCGNNRVVHLSASRTPIANDEIAYQGNSYSGGVNLTDPTSVFNTWKEFKVDYTKPGAPAKLYRNFGATAPAVLFGLNNRRQNIELGTILANVVTFPSGRTYGTARYYADASTKGVYELTNAGLVLITTIPERQSIGADGSIYFAQTALENLPGTIRYFKKPLTSDPSTGNPTWGFSTQIGSYTGITNTDPADFSGFPPTDTHVLAQNGTRPVFQSGLAQRYEQSDGSFIEFPDRGPRLAGIPAGQTTPAWKAAYATGKYYKGRYPKNGAYPNGNRAFNDKGGQNGHNNGVVRTLGPLVIYNSPGEGFDDYQTNYFHFHHQEGQFLFVYGTDQREANEAGQRLGYPGMAGNVLMFGVAVDPTNPDVGYIYHSSEGGPSGTMRWKITGLLSLYPRKARTFTIANGLGFNKPKREGVDILADPTRWSDSVAQSNNYYVEYDVLNPNRFASADHRIFSRTTAERIYAIGPVNSANWSVEAVVTFDRNSGNDGNIQDSNSGGQYYQVCDVNGKILARFFIKSNFSVSPAKTELWANNTVLLQQSYDNPQPRITDKPQPLVIQSTGGQLSVSYAGYSANVTAFESGALVNQPATLRITSWEKGVARDRVTGLLDVVLKGGGQPPVTENIYALSATRKEPEYTDFTYETQQLVVRNSVPAFNTGATEYTIKNRNFRYDAGRVVDLYMPNGELIIFENCVFAGDSQSNLIHITDHSRAKFVNCRFYGINGSRAVGVQNARAIYSYAARHVQVEHCYFSNTAGCKLELWSNKATAADTVIFRYNRVENIRGGTGSDYRQFVQLQHIVERPGMVIQWNQVVNEPGKSRVEDNINLGESSGTVDSLLLVENNFVKGAYHAKPTDSGFTGTGMTSDAGGSSVTAINQPHYILARKNIFVSTMNAAMNIAAGHHITYTDNDIVCSGKLPDGTNLSSANNAVAVFKGQSSYTDEQFNNNRIEGNRINYRPRAFFANSAYVGPGSTSLVTGNTFNDYRTDATLADEQAAFDTLWLGRLTDNKIQVGVLP